MELLIGVVRFPVSPLVPSCLDGCKKKSRYRLIPNFSLVGLNLNKIQLASTVSAPGMHLHPFIIVMYEKTLPRAKEHAHIKIFSWMNWRPFMIIARNHTLWVVISTL